LPFRNECPILVTKEVTIIMKTKKTFPLILLTLFAFHPIFRDLSAGPIESQKTPASPQKAAASTQAPLVIPHTTLSIKVDGVLDEDVWKTARVFELRYETSPGENIAPPVRTECLLISNANYLMGAFRCYDPRPAQIRAHYSDRDQIMNDDRVVLTFDTFNDERRNFEFAGNPLGVQGDFIRLNQNLDASWDAIWDCAGRIEDWGYVVEFAIPFDQLRFRKTDGPQTWGFGAFRMYPRNVVHTISLSPDDRNNNCAQCQLVKIQGFEEAVPGKAVELTPTLTAARTEFRPQWPLGGFQTQNQEADLGLTAKWGLTPNLTLQGTINPDFSQVEADALQMNINQPFALFYREKRPFFTEGADYFETLSNVEIEGLQNPIYTRAIRDPRWGLKLTGKEGGNTFGLYSLQDGITNIVFPGPERSFSASLSSTNISSVFRLSRDFGSQATVGALVTDREGGEYFNRVFGFDADIRLGEQDRFIAQALGSSTRYPGSLAATFNQPQGPFADWMWLVHYTHDARNYRYFADYQDLGSDFRADLGYIPKVGYTKAEVGGGLTWWGDGSGFLNRAVVDTAIRQMKKTDGSLMLRTFEIMGSLQGPGNSTAFLYYGARDRNYEGQRLKQDFKGFGLESRPSGSLSLGAFCSWEDKIDYDRNRPAAEFAFTPQISFNPNRHLNLNLNYTYLTLDVSGGQLFRVNALDTAFIYQFSRKIFFRAILQYMDVLRNPSLYDTAVDARSKTLFSQLLFSYKLNPRTVVFLGYTDNAMTDPSLRLMKTDRTLFVKIGYAWTL
jgi:hypothetical protein